MFFNEFYNDCELFVTGGSGVVGKAVIEKLLRSCNVRKIYVLLRPRKSLSVDERLLKLRKTNIFNVLNAEKPEALDKLVAIPGDVALPKMNISPEHAKLMANVSIVFHCAATVRFDESLRDALTLNVGGTLECVRFAETLKNLKIFMHVSTFYSNPYLKYVEPKLYSSPMDWRFCLDMLNKIKDDNLLDALTRKMLVGFPNTYTFTKNLAESLVNDFRQKIPLIIFRPSIVLFSLREPERGFSPSLMGAMGLFTLVGAGILKTVYLGTNVRLDITPQDLCVKLMLYYSTLGCNIYQKGIPDVVPVYLSSSCTYSPFTFRQLAEFMNDYQLWQRIAFEKNLLIPGCKYTESRILYKFLVFTKQIIPGMLADFLIILSGRKPVIMRAIRRAYTTLEVMQPFMFNNYESPGTTHLQEMMNTSGTLDDWNDLTYANNEMRMVELCGSMLLSVRKDLINEDPKTLQRARNVIHIKEILYYFTHCYLTYRLVTWAFNAIF